MKYLIYIDVFGTEFHLYTRNKRKFHSIEGGVLSLIYILCCIVIFIIISGKDFMYQNPISNSSTIPSVDTNE